MSKQYKHEERILSIIACLLILAAVIIQVT
jgi:hypothetical protein